jgi:hypothetical protein
VIEPTDEMIYAFAGEPEITATDAHAIRVGLAAVLAIVEREHVIETSKLRGALTIAGKSRALWVKRARDFREALADLVDPEPCSQFDHDGDCQTHGTGSARPCPHARARELLDEQGPARATRTGD